MSRNEILQIVVFSLFFGVAMAALGERSRPVVEVLDVVAHIMLKVTGYVMLFAPLAVFGALAGSVAKEGLEIIRVYGIFMGEFYLGLIILWALLITLGGLIIGPRILKLIRRVREPTILAFSTASSEAAYPKTLEELERFGCSNRVASFVLPVGYSFNLDGSMMYCTFAVLFIAQLYGIEVPIADQIARKKDGYRPQFNFGPPGRNAPLRPMDDTAIGEVVTCSRCVGTWAAAGLATAQILAPRFGRMLTWTLAGAGVNDFLQSGFAALTRKANENEA